MMLFEIINPSDPYTMTADSLEVAAVAVCFLGQGQYALKQLDGDAEVPMFPFTGHDEWFTETFGRDFNTSIVHVCETDAAGLAKALGSVFIGDATSRQEFDDMAANCKTPEEFDALLRTTHDARRTSQNDIGRRAWALADAVQSQYGVEIAPQAAVTPEPASRIILLN